MNDSTTPDATDGAASAVHVIESTFHYDGPDGRPTTDVSVVVDEGWFEDLASANVRREQLNDRLRRAHASDMERARRDRETKIATAEQTNREAAILRANGIDKPDVPVPSPFTPTPFERYVPQHSFTTYEVVQIHRSELDGIASAADAAKN